MKGGRERSGVRGREKGEKSPISNPRERKESDCEDILSQTQINILKRAITKLPLP
jgi:hypothetical protein